MTTSVTCDSLRWLVARFVGRPSGTWELTYERDPIGGQLSIDRGIPAWWIGFRLGEGSRWYSGLVAVNPRVDSEELFVFGAIAAIWENVKAGHDGEVSA